MTELADTSVEYLNTMFNLCAANTEKDCDLPQCPSVACWQVLWDEGACTHVPTHVCVAGKNLIEEAVATFFDHECDTCGSPMVPAAFLRLKTLDV